MARKVTIADLRAVARAHPDRTNPEAHDENGDPTSLYFDPATKCPSCIVGHALARAGWTPSDVVENVNPLSDEVRPLFASEKAAKLALEAQDRADKGFTWARALKEAEAELARE